MKAITIRRRCARKGMAGRNTFCEIGVYRAQIPGGVTP